MQRQTKKRYPAKERIYSERRKEEIANAMSIKDWIEWRKQKAK